MNESLLMQFIRHSKAGYMIFVLDQPLQWNDSIDKEKAIDYYFKHASVSFCNQAYSELMQVEEKEVLGKTTFDFFTFSLEYGKRSIRELLENGIQDIAAFEARPGVWLEGINQCIYDESGRVAGHTSMIISDTNSKREAQLIADQETMKQISNFQYCILPDGSEYFSHISYELLDLFGISPDNTPRTMQDVMNLVYFADAERVIRLVDKSFANKTNIEIEFRINHPAKGVRWIKSIALPDKNSADRSVWNGYFTDCTERKQKDEWIGFLNTALMNISDSVILTNSIGEIIYANRRVRDLHGYEPDELLGRSPTILEAQPSTDEEQNIMLTAMSEGRTYTNINASRRKDGSTFICEYSVAPIFDENGSIYASIGLQNDITERIRMVDALRQSNEQLRATLLSVGEGVIATDAQGTVTMMNPIAEELTEWPQEDAQGKPFSEVFTIIGEGDKQPRGDPAGIVLKTSSSFKTADPVLLVSQSGKEKPIEIQASPIKNENGATTGAVIVFRDFTEYRDRQKKIEYLSFHDPLTGLYNRRFMEDAVSRADLAKNLPLTVMVVDVNGLKLTNDAFGHKTGDQLLIAVAGILQQTCKPDSVIARMGGDEFQILMPMTNFQEAKIIKQNISKAAESVTLDSAIVSLAIGISVKSDPEESIEVIMMNADNQMYKEKLKHGKTMRNQTVETVLRNINYKYDREQIHTERVSQYSEAIAKAMGLSEQDVTDIKNAGALHDIGKIVVPPELLNKPDKLTEEEYDIVKRHAETGYQILKSADEYAKLAEFVLYHHERWDGGGYPHGLKGAEIPLQARIISVADAFEAMTALRSYQATRSKEEATAELVRCSGKQFDPRIVDIFVKHVLGQV
jgi:diguanylate cyclase (GGDEF)-like protein/PAS domain S-box-containing protein/putative nucleotidyltransferase with HDIG domain